MASAPPVIALPATVIRDHLSAVLQWIELENGEVIVELGGKPSYRIRLAEPGTDRRTVVRRRMADLLSRRRRKPSP